MSWVSQAEAAALTGVPVATVEFAARRGKFVKRDVAPSLRRDTVVAWAEQRRVKQARAAANRERRAEVPVPIPEGWVTVTRAAEILGMAEASVHRLARQADLPSTKAGRRIVLDKRLLEEIAAERRAWVSQRTAAALVGCSERAITNAVGAGLIEKRHVSHVLPSLRLASVEAFANNNRA